jgi:hypothetical protein
MEDTYLSVQMEQMHCSLTGTGDIECQETTEGVLDGNGS